jgi:hypothetical protein
MLNVKKNLRKNCKKKKLNSKFQKISIKNTIILF